MFSRNIPGDAARGNLMVIMVVTMSRRLRSVTNFLLANLAFADLCVGIFCVFQNLYIHLATTWVLGDALCKMFQFVHSLSYTASILILVVICTERYVAIIHPMACKSILTPTRLMVVVSAVWFLSAAYSAPRLGWMQTVRFNFSGGPPEVYCLSNIARYNRQLFDVLTFVLLYLLPLAIMMALYSRIAVALWRSSRGLEDVEVDVDPRRQPSCRRKVGGSGSFKVRFSTGRSVRLSTRGKRTLLAVAPAQDTPSASPELQSGHGHGHAHSHQEQRRASAQNVLRARRGVVRMLIAVVLAFAACNLPLHARKMWQLSPSYPFDTPFAAVFSLLTFLATYLNAALDPLLYAFMSRNFRRGARELLCAPPPPSPPLLLAAAEAQLVAVRVAGRQRAQLTAGAQPAARPRVSRRGWQSVARLLSLRPLCELETLCTRSRCDIVVERIAVSTPATLTEQHYVSKTYESCDS
ncbi:trissin receptor [Schistocerca nitens]|uniref:trissin receptor n=1 Tax=Schistocerca nitens TaxID=7011 RepID=UPI002117A202|nr:trissin receptor [Schistocerca nitens]